MTVRTIGTKAMIMATIMILMIITMMVIIAMVIVYSTRRLIKNRNKQKTNLQNAHKSSKTRPHTDLIK